MADVWVLLPKVRGCQVVFAGAMRFGAPCCVFHCFRYVRKQFFAARKAAEGRTTICFKLKILP